MIIESKMLTVLEANTNICCACSLESNPKQFGNEAIERCDSNELPQHKVCSLSGLHACQCLFALAHTNSVSMNSRFQDA